MRSSNRPAGNDVTFSGTTKFCTRFGCRNRVCWKSTEAHLPNNIRLSLSPTDGRWYGFAARARVLIVNTNLLPDLTDRPTSIMDLADPKWKDNCGIAKPLFGTTATHAAVLFAQWGDERAEKFSVGRQSQRTCRRRQQASRDQCRKRSLCVWSDRHRRCHYRIGTGQSSCDRVSRSAELTVREPY